MQDLRRVLEWGGVVERLCCYMVFLIKFKFFLVVECMACVYCTGTRYVPARTGRAKKIVYRVGALSTGLVRYALNIKTT